MIFEQTVLQGEVAPRLRGRVGRRNPLVGSRGGFLGTVVKVIQRKWRVEWGEVADLIIAYFGKASFEKGLHGKIEMRPDIA